jgi:hypothetical protein
MKIRLNELDSWLPSLAALLLLASGAGLAGNWAYGLTAPALVAFAWLAYRAKWRWGANALLLAYLGLAVNGLFQGFSPALVIAGTTAALVAWELSSPPLEESSTNAVPLAMRFRRQRLRSLLFTAVLGLALAEVGLILRLRLSFLGVLLAALLVLFCLYGLFSFPARRK